MSNAMAFKSLIKKKSIDYQLPTQVILQNYMFEHFLLRLVRSPYQRNFILKGGFLISALVGISSRTTMDMDITIQGITLQVASIEKVVNQIIKIDVNDLVIFKFISVEEIRALDDYPGLRVRLEAKYESIKVDMKLDFTTGDVLTPNSIKTNHSLFSEEKTILLCTYNVETILAEKLETVISRNVLNTRIRDFYDIYVLYKMYRLSIDMIMLSKAIRNTSMKRGTLETVVGGLRIIESLRTDKTMILNWNKYQTQFEYAKEISFAMIIKTIEGIFSQIIL